MGLAIVFRKAGFLELFLKRVEIEFLAPGRGMLGMEHPECIGDGVDIEHALLPSCFLQLGETSIDLIAIDHAINDDVAHVESAGAEFPRHPLGDGSKGHKRVESLPRKAASQRSPSPCLAPTPTTTATWTF